jgi:ketosteroid isomerase-like protein
MSTQSSEALGVAKKFISALERQDGDALCNMLHKDVVCENPYPVVAGEDKPGSIRAQGASVHAHMRNMPNVLKSMEFKNPIWRTSSDGLIIFQGDGDAKLPNGTPYKNVYFMMFKVEGGKIVYWAEYYNPAIPARANGMPLDLIPWDFDSKSGIPQQGQPPETEALKAAKKLMDGVTNLDPEGMIAVMDENIVLEVIFPLVKGENTTGTRIQKGRAVHAYAHDVKARTEQMRFTNVIWRTTDDGLAIFQADGGHLLKDGRTYKNHWLFLFEVANGKVTRWVEYLNPVAALRAFGAPLDSLP